MKANELMIGDWLLREGTPAKIRGVEIYCSNLYVQTNLTDAWYTSNFIEPIPLTKEILEKNEFVKGDTIDHGDEIYCVKLFNIHYDNEERQFWVCNFFESEYGKEMMDIFRIDYVHELQHALRLCKVDKEIVL